MALLFKITSPFTTEINATVKQALSQGAIDIQGHWKNLLLPVGDYGNIASQSGSINVTGSLKKYSLDLNTDIYGTDIPSGNWVIRGTGSLKQLDLSTIRLDTLQGTINGRVALRWNPDIQWNTNLLLNNINPGIQWPDWPANINCQIISAGNLNETKPSASIAINNIHGSLQSKEMSGDINIHWQKNDLDIPKLNLMVGDNLFHAQGYLTNVWNIQWQMNAPDLTEILPSASGSIFSNGDISGKEKTPKIESNTQIKNLLFNDYHITSLQLNSDLNLATSGIFRGTLIAHNIYHHNYGLRGLNLLLTGTPAYHQLTGNISITGAKLNIKVNGQHKKNYWSEKINQLSLQSKHYKKWHLKSPFTIMTTPTNIKIDRFCWIANVSNLCGQFNWNSRFDWQLQLQGDQIPSTFINHLLTHQLTLDTLFKLNINLQGSPSGKPIGAINLSASQGSIRNKTENTTVFNFTSMLLDAQASQKELTTTFTIKNKLQTLLGLNLRLPDYNTNIPFLYQNITGKLSASLSPLNFLPLFIPSLSDTNGTFTSTLNISGPILTPTLSGTSTLSNLSATITPLKITLNKTNLYLNSDANDTLAFQGQTNADNGTLKLDGTIALDQEDQPLTLNITGNNFPVINNNEYKINITPHLKITHNKSKINISGTVNIPSAQITPEDFTSTVSLPSNAVVIDYNHHSPFKENFGIYTNVTLTLGDAVAFGYDGLLAQLAGALNVNSAPNELTTANGTLSVKEGYYRAYNTKLTIEEGKLTYTGGPINNPELSIRATKTINQSQDAAAAAPSSTKSSTSSTEAPSAHSTMTPKKVGVSVTGTLKKPMISLISEPGDMKDSDILSYLILGSSTQDNSQEESKLLLETAKNMGIKNDYLYNDIASTFGLSDFGVENNMMMDPEDSSLQQNPEFVIGKYVTPRLYLNYGVGLVVPVNIIRLRYTVSKRVSVQTETSTLGNGADVYYSFQTN